MRACSRLVCSLVWNCNICGETSNQVEHGAVKSNCRKFGDQRFALWRCPKCSSVHAASDVDLDEAYRDYAYHAITKDASMQWLLQLGYRNLLARLRSVGLRPGHTVLDYGCGSAGFLMYARSKGFQVE